jgi:DNA helicase HerA-like ATPase
MTLKVIAEGFSDMGVPVFLGDIKGDLSGMVKPGEHSEALAARLMAVGVPDFSCKSYPTVFWDVYGEQGHPVRVTISEMGPLLLGRMLNLNETQTGVLSIIFRVADDESMLLLDIKDLKAMLA